MSASQSDRSVSDGNTALHEESLQTTLGIAESWAALSKVAARVAPALDTTLSDALAQAHETSSIALSNIERFLADSPRRTNLSELRVEFDSALAQSETVRAGVPSSVAELLSAEEAQQISAAFAPLSRLAERFTRELLTHRDEIERAVIASQETLRIVQGLELIRAEAVENLMTDLQKIRMVSESRDKLIAFALEKVMYPLIEPILLDPLKGKPDSAALDAAIAVLTTSKRIDFTRGSIFFHDESTGVPRALRAILKTAGHFEQNVDTLLRSSLCHPERSEGLAEFLSPGPRTTTHGLVYNFDYRWNPDPTKERCLLTLASPWGNRAEYRYTLRPTPGNAVPFRNSIRELHSHIESLSYLHEPSNTAYTIEQRLHDLGGSPEVCAQPIRTVEEFLRESRLTLVGQQSESALREDVRQALSQTFTLKPLRVGTEGIDDSRFNRVGIDLQSGVLLLRLFRQSDSGVTFGSAPRVTLQTKDLNGTRVMLRELEDTLMESRGDIASPPGQAALRKLIEAQSSSLLDGTKLFEVMNIRNLTLSDYGDLEICLAPGASVTDLALRRSEITLATERVHPQKRVRISNVVGDATSSVCLNLSHADLRGLELKSARLLCQECRAEDSQIERLSRESASAWKAPENRNSFADPTRGRISRSLSNRLIELFGGAPSYSMRSRSI